VQTIQLPDSHREDDHITVIQMRAGANRTAHQQWSSLASSRGSSCVHHSNWRLRNFLSPITIPNSSTVALTALFFRFQFSIRCGNVHCCTGKNSWA